MTENNSPPSPNDLDARLRKARARQAKASGDGKGGGAGAMSGLGMAVKIGVEMVSALIVGVGIGWGLDWWLGTGPWLMIVFFFLGSGAGILNVYRATASMGFANGSGTKNEGNGPMARVNEDDVDRD